MTLSIYGSSGFVGSRYCEFNPVKRVERNALASETNDIVDSLLVDLHAKFDLLESLMLEL